MFALDIKAIPFGLALRGDGGFSSGKPLKLKVSNLPDRVKIDFSIYDNLDPSFAIDLTEHTPLDQLRLVYESRFGEMQVTWPLGEIIKDAASDYLLVTARVENASYKASLWVWNPSKSRLSSVSSLKLFLETLVALPVQIIGNPRGDHAVEDFLYQLEIASHYGEAYHIGPVPQTLGVTGFSWSDSRKILLTTANNLALTAQRSSEADIPLKPGLHLWDLEKQRMKLLFELDGGNSYLTAPQALPNRKTAVIQQRRGMNKEAGHREVAELLILDSSYEVEKRIPLALKVSTIKVTSDENILFLNSYDPLYLQDHLLVANLESGEIINLGSHFQLPPSDLKTDPRTKRLKVPRSLENQIKPFREGDNHELLPVLQRNVENPLLLQLSSDGNRIGFLRRDLGY
jgi:hypothetical protein